MKYCRPFGDIVANEEIYSDEIIPGKQWRVQWENRINEKSEEERARLFETTKLTLRLKVNSIIFTNVISLSLSHFAIARQRNNTPQRNVQLLFRTKNKKPNNASCIWIVSERYVAGETSELINYARLKATCYFRYFRDDNFPVSSLCSLSKTKQCMNRY